MTEDTGLGLFVKLPREIRKRIWLEFLPSGCDSLSKSYQTQTRKSHLDLLRASRSLYYEVSGCLYSNTFLQFYITPYNEDGIGSWATVCLDKTYQSGKGGFQRKASWFLDGRDHARLRGFYNLSLHPNIESIVVHLFAPDQSQPCELSCLRSKVKHLVQMLKEAGPLPPLTIRLHSCGRHAWVTPEDNCRGGYAHNAVALPFFFGLQNARSVKAEVPSKKVHNKMNWAMINWASEIFRKRANKSVPGRTEPITSPPTQVFGKRVAEDDI